MRSLLVEAGQPAVSRYVSRQDCCEPSFYSLRGQRYPPANAALPPDRLQHSRGLRMRPDFVVREFFALLLCDRFHGDVAPMAQLSPSTAL